MEVCMMETLYSLKMRLDKSVDLNCYVRIVLAAEIVCVPFLWRHIELNLKGIVSQILFFTRFTLTMLCFAHLTYFFGTLTTLDIKSYSWQAHERQQVNTSSGLVPSTPRVPQYMQCFRSMDSLLFSFHWHFLPKQKYMDLLQYFTSSKHLYWILRFSSYIVSTSWSS